MLITKNPLTLQSISSFGIYSDSLGEKIRGNYQVFGTAIAGEDLIHMTMMEPDIYVGIQNNGPFMVDNQIHMDNQVRLELVNQLINRIMLYDSPEFTYQDEVFVSTVLQKLGVADVNEFMRQIKLHMENNALAVSLINKYFEEGRQLAYTVSEFLESRIYEEQELEIIKNEYQSDRYLHNEIFNRLMTAECSNMVYTYQNPVRTRQSVVKSFHDMEWMRQADQIQLSQLRENIFYQTNPAVFCDYFTYEAKPLAVHELTQQKVIGRMSAAILENLVNAVSYELQYVYGGTNIWKNYSRILVGSAKSALDRFRYFQADSGISEAHIREYAIRMNELTRDELHLTQLLEFVNRYDVLRENDALYEELTKNIVISVLENQNLQKQLTKEIQMVQQTDVWEQPNYYDLEEENLYFNEMKRFDEAYRVLRQKKNENYYSTVMDASIRDNDMDFSDDGAALELLAAIEEETAQKAHVAGREKNSEEPLQKTADRIYDRVAEPIRIQEADGGRTVYEMIRRYAKLEADSDVPLMENIELLEQINQHNVHMQQLLDSKEQQDDTPRRVVVDRAQAREAALRALEHPEQVLQEIYENAAAGTILSGEIPKEIERILSVTDESTRSYYERLMGYRSEEASGTAPKNNERYEDAQSSDEYSSREINEESLYLETIKEVLNTTDADTQTIYRQSMEYRDADIAYPQEALVHEQTLTQKEQEQFVNLQEKVYSLLRFIEHKERAYRTYREYTAAQTQEIVEDVQQKLLWYDSTNIHNLNIDELVSLEHLHTAQRENVLRQHITEKEIELVHKTREQIRQEIVEEALETIENSTVLRKDLKETSEETILTQRQLEDIRNEVIRQSREHITRMVERNMKTQVHEISDMVYLELERRLKNEQRRRGY